MYQAGQLLWWSRRHSPLFTRNSSPGTLSPDYYPHALHSWPTIPSSATLRHWLGLSRALSLSQSQFHVITVNLRREVIMQFLCRRDPARPDQTRPKPNQTVWCVCVWGMICVGYLSIIKQGQRWMMPGRKDGKRGGELHS